MNAIMEVPEVVAESTHSRVDWNEPEANELVKAHTGPIAILRDTDGKFLAVEDVPQVPDVATPVTLVQHMKSSDLRRQCIVWARWDGVKEAGFWDSMPARMPLYKAEVVGANSSTPEPRAKRPAKPRTKAVRAPRKTA